VTIKIGSNTASLNAQRRLGESSAKLSGIYERLSSGQRINKASDDAAGLAIANDLNAKGRIFTQGIRNGNDGISLLNIADSAIDALTGVVTRIRELSEQSANGTYSAQQRKALDAEAQALSKEFTRITQTTSFNGIKIFDGSLGQGVRLQLGNGISESINASIGGHIATGNFSSSSTFTTESHTSRAATLGDLNGDGILDLVTAGYSDSFDGYATVRLGLGDGSFGTASHFSSESFKTTALGLGDLNGDGILDLVTAGQSDASTNWHGYATVRLGLGDGSFGSSTQFTTESGYSNALRLGDLNGDGILDLVTAGTTSSYNGYATVRLGLGNGSFGAASQFSTESSASLALNLADLNGDGVLDLITAGQSDPPYDGYATIRPGLGDGSFGDPIQYTTESLSSVALSIGDLNGDGILDLVTAGISDSIDGYASIRLGLGNGTFGSSTRFSTETNSSYAVSLADLNGDNILDLVSAGRSDSGGGYTTLRLGLGNGSFGNATRFSSESGFSFALSIGDLNGDGVLDLVTAGRSPSNNGLTTARLGDSEDGLGALLNFSLKTKSDALQSMGMLDRTLQNLAEQRGIIGASQSRVNIAIGNLQAAKENFAAAESRIRDADVASEAANLVRTQILQQAAASVLAQANQVPALALQLLR